MNQVVEYIVNNRNSVVRSFKKRITIAQDIEDVYQDAVEKALLYCNNLVFDHELKLKSYVEKFLYSVAISYIQDKTSSNKKTMFGEDLVNNDDVGMTFEQLFETQLATHKDPLQIMVEEEGRQALTDIVKRIRNPLHKEIIELAVLRGVDLKDVARQLNTSYGNVRIVYMRFKDSVL